MLKNHEKYVYTSKTRPSGIACPEKADSEAEDEERERRSKGRCYGTER